MAASAAADAAAAAAEAEAAARGAMAATKAAVANDTAVAATLAVAEASAAAPAAPPPPPPPAVAPSAEGPLLVIGVPSLPREGDLDYLLRTLGYIIAQTTGGGGAVAAAGGSDAPGAHPLRVRVLVMDHSRAPGTHGAFEEAARLYCHALGGCARVEAPGQPQHAVLASRGGVVAFATNGVPRAEDGEDPGNDNVPGARVRAQTRDVVALLRLAAALYGAGGALAPGGSAGFDAYMFLEDDFRVCPSGLAALAFAFARAGALQPDWNALRVSYGLNGGVLRAADVSTFAAYLEEHQARRPPDHLWVEWFAGERPQSAARKAGRPHVAFRYNVLEHFGASSSLRAKVAPLYAMCYDELNEKVVFEVEAFKPLQCAHDWVWPCWPAGDGRYAEPQRALPQPGVDFEALARNAAADSVQKYAMAR